MSKNTSEKNLIIAMILSMAILFGFQMFFKSNPKKTAPMGITVPLKDKVVEKAEKAENLKKETSEIDTSTLASEKLREADTTIDTGKIVAIFTNRGAALKKLSLISPGLGEEKIYEETDPGKMVFAMDLSNVPDLAERTFTAASGKGFLEYKFVAPGEVEVSKRFSYEKGGDIINAEVKIKNISGQERTFSYNMIGASGVRSEDEGGRKYLQADAAIGGKVWKVKDAKKERAKTGEIGWVALKNRYFTALLKPVTPFRAVSVRTTDGKDLVSIVTSQEYALDPGVIRTDDYKFYAGPLDEKRISAIGEDVLAVVDLGIFSGVSRFLLKIMHFFYGITHNWGVAIILLTLSINLLLFPLTIKSFTSMQQMKKIQPHVDKLKELHKDNPQRMNKEVMELYKKYNVNPLGGCLPLLLQMPIFIALYQALNNSIELKGSKFLWISDLAKPDGVHIPATLPVIGNKINILPLLMVVAMFLQQRISQNLTGAAMSAEQASQQKIMMVVFPLLFGFMFYNMPSGLVLYWLTNTVLMTAEQGAISKRLPQ